MMRNMIVGRPRKLDDTTTIATTPDDAVTAQIHASLKQRDLLPDVHLTDMGYIDAELLGPVRGDYRRL